MSYVKRSGVIESEVRMCYLQPISHPNLVNLRETFIVDKTAFFVYELWGISLREFRQLQPIFRLGEVEAATICGQVGVDRAPDRQWTDPILKILKGLSYIYDELGIVHGKIQEGNIYIMENGNVKIGTRSSETSRYSSILTARLYREYWREDDLAG